MSISESLISIGNNVGAEQFAEDFNNDLTISTFDNTSKNEMNESEIEEFDEI